jgi:hypothetical protein
VLRRDVDESTAAIAAKETSQLGASRQSEIVGRHIGYIGRDAAAAAVTGDEQVQRAVVVEIPEPRGEAGDGTRHVQLGGDVQEGPVAVVSIKAVSGAQVGDVEIR